MKSVSNLRDLGSNSKVKDILKENVLLRGGHLHKLSEEDINFFIKQKELSVVIDFRTQEESDKQPDKIMEGVEIIKLDIFKGIQNGPNGNPDKFDVTNQTEAKKKMILLYETFVANKLVCQRFGEFIKQIAKQTNGASYYHCSVGKDRTGFASMILYKLLGISDAIIMEDYLYSNYLRKEKNEEIYQVYAKRNNMELTDSLKETLSASYEAKAEYLNAIYNKIDDLYGDWDNFVENGLGVDEHTIQALRERCLINV